MNSRFDSKSSSDISEYLGFNGGQGLGLLEEKDLCYVDDETAKSLELLNNNVDSANRKHSLFGYLNVYTCTTSGARLLREGITKPLCHLETIEHRLDCIEYLVNRSDVLGCITSCLKNFGQNVDLDSVPQVLSHLIKTRTSTIHAAEKRLEALTIVESLISNVELLICTLRTTDQRFLNVYRNELEDPAYSEILNDIYSVVEPRVEPKAKSVRGKRSRIFCLRQGVESLFDISRSTYQAAIEDLEQYVRELHKEDGLPWKLTYTETKGYCLILSLDQVPKNITLSSRYIRVHKTRTTITCTTIELCQSDVRAKVSYENSMKLANEILVDALNSLMTNVHAIHKLVDIVAMLDLVTSFAQLVTNSHGTLVRPKFTAMDTIVTESRHPLLESVLNSSNIRVVPNDITFSVGHKNFMLITGPNMGGKSVFLKQIALIQIMAQLGCYVPAKSAHIKLMNRIIVRSGASDDTQSNCSSFMKEMRGIATALQQNRTELSQSVLYVIDEVGRGTSIDDGASYSFAIAEELCLRKNCFTAFATHFDQVFALTLLYRNVTAYHFNYETRGDDDSKSKISHRLEPGVAERDHYGIKLAIACGLPDEIIQVASFGLEYI